MKKTVLSIALALVAFQASAHDHSAHDTAVADTKTYHQVQTVNDVLTIENARAKATIPGVKVSAGYMKITNDTDEPIRLVEANSSIAKHTEFHRMFMRDSQMAMRKVDALEIPANGSIELKPKDYHLMFMGVKEALKPGQEIKVTLVADNGEKFDVQLTVMPMTKY
ncbi:MULTISPECIES: copper chaperone PCu(A)C [unclassified Photobacterium]|uniref:copper chaperone PCu(A)C n=1 Tax=unclassified Photobacterium TaxID=2628852 RepID=UPI000D165FD4|nr:MULTISPECIES: copper chaperone PCu(A)C [unclassified Photobacterium]PSV33053.1 transporter [Photobacterium sp. GB-72]PSV40986.1 transporter [Photobacterium sp. GB-210]PSV47913.1 transporter [Photobacterium sp. GB-36]